MKKKLPIAARITRSSFASRITSPLLIIPFLLLQTLIAKAQLDSCNIFLQSNYLEVGINWNGAYGSSVNAPTGYHPKGSSAVANSAICDSGCATAGLNLGFVADPDKDGWTVGSPYPYYGDYFLPGVPQEGWSIMADGKQANAWNKAGCASPSLLLDTNIKGNNISYTASGAHRIGVWQGMYDSIQITQVTILDTGDTYFTVQVTLKNTGAGIRRNVYYLRTLDPDNAEPQTAIYTTINKIEYQLPNARNEVLVSAVAVDSTGTHPLSSAYIALGTIDTAAKCFIIKNDLSPDSGTLDSIYEKGGIGDTTNYMYSGGDTLDVGIGLIFKVGTLYPPDSIVLSYAYSFRKADNDSALNHHTTAIGVINTGENIHISPNPFRNKITVSGLNPSDQVTIYDIMGRKVSHTQTTNSQGSNVLYLNNIPSGMYVLQIVDKNGNVITKKPIQKL